MTAILHALGWPLAIVLLLVAALTLARIARSPFRRGGKGLGGQGADWRHLGPWVTLVMFTCAGVAALTVSGAISPVTGGVIAGVLAVLLALALEPWTRKGRFAAGHNVTGAFGYLGRDARGIGGWLRGLWSRRRGGGRVGKAAGAGEVVSIAAAQRAVPALRDDDSLGPVPAAEVIASAPVAPDRAALIARIAGFEPETDAVLIAFIRSEASAHVAEADAWRQLADTLLSGVGLDPAYAAGVAEFGDVIGDTAHDLVLVDRRFEVIYGAVNEQIAGGLILPHNAREWLTGGEAA